MVGPTHCFFSPFVHNCLCIVCGHRITREILITCYDTCFSGRMGPGAHESPENGDYEHIPNRD